MRSRVRILIYSLVSCVSLIPLLSGAKAGASAEDDIAIIVHPENPVNNLTLSELRKLYMGERLYWKGNAPVVLLMRTKGASERDAVLRLVFQMSEEQYTQYWVAKVMRAEVSDPPASLFSHGFVQEGVRGNPGAIGYVKGNEVRPGVKVVRIGGLLPGDPGYPLRDPHAAGARAVVVSTSER